MNPAEKPSREDVILRQADWIVDEFPNDALEVSRGRHGEKFIRGGRPRYSCLTSQPNF